MFDEAEDIIKCVFHREKEGHENIYRRYLRFSAMAVNAEIMFARAQYPSACNEAERILREWKKEDPEMR